MAIISYLIFKYYLHETFNKTDDYISLITNKYYFFVFIFKAIHGLGNQQDVIDAAEAKSKVLDFNALKELLNVGFSVHRNLERLNDYGNELAVQNSKIKKLKSTVKNMEKGNILLEKNDMCARLYMFCLNIHPYLLKQSVLNLFRFFLFYYNSERNLAIAMNK